MAKLFSLILTVVLFFESLPLVWLPTLTVDAGQKGDAVSNYATGFLYGIASPSRWFWLLSLPIPRLCFSSRLLQRPPFQTSGAAFSAM